MTGRPFSVGVAAAHPDLGLAYPRHLVDTSPAKQLHQHVKEVRSALNGLFKRSGFLPVANCPACQALSRRLKRLHFPAPKKTKDFTCSDTASISMRWSFGLAESGAPAFSVNAGAATACYWRDAPYRLWVALAVRLVMEAVARVDDLSFVAAASVTFARDGGVRVLSVCFT